MAKNRSALDQVAAVSQEKERLALNPICPYVEVHGCRMGNCSGRRCAFKFRVPHPYVD